MLKITKVDMAKNISGKFQKKSITSDLLKNLLPGTITYVCLRIYFTPYFKCFRVKSIFPPKINNLGQYYIPDAPCSFICYLNEEEWRMGLQRGKYHEGLL